VTLTAADVAEIMRLVEQSKFDELSLEIDGVKLTLRRSGATGEIAQSIGLLNAAATATSRPDAPRSDALRSPASIARTAALSVAAGLGVANLSDITSPMLGTFYRAPKPGSAPFVQIGSVVDEDSVIAIIEVMKLMNTVRAGAKGVITEILPADETLVEFGEVLMRVRKDA
jgi:acetyl-CoA carboxylase biotin carboxyl carrier protein